MLIAGLVLIVGTAAVVAWARQGGEGSSASPAATTFVGSVFDGTGELIGPLTLPKVIRTDAEWRTRLTPAQYNVVRKGGTERAFTGTLLENKAAGVYTCVACGLPLFSSGAKFESGTGWPSYFKAIAGGNVGETVDNSWGMQRTEITCGRCDGHLGHVFDDGPQPTGLRYCVNSESIAFTPMDDVKKLADPAVTTTAPAQKDAAAPSSGQAKIVFAGGCFWCVEVVFEELDGVIDAVSGYAGGTRETANYRDVCSGKTGHAEAVQIIYDPSKIAYEDLLRVHFATHDPTQLNRQGNDVGPQYRSAIFYANDQEKAIAQAFIDDLRRRRSFRVRS